MKASKPDMVSKGTDDFIKEMKKERGYFTYIDEHFTDSNLFSVVHKLIDLGIIKKNSTDLKYYIDEQVVLNSIPVSLGFEDVAIVQKKNVCKSRNDVDTRSEVFRGVYRDIPIMASNMSSVTNAEFCIKLDKLGALGILHRGADVYTLVDECEKIAKECEIVCASIGVGKESEELCENLICAGANVIFIDIAQGFSDTVIEIGRKIKRKYPRIKVVVGNTINPDMVREVADFADALKVGIAQGCFAAGSRVLMSNGFYKNIEDVRAGDRVINKHGESVAVVKSFCTGFKRVMSVKSNLSPNPTTVTPDHPYLVGDLSSTSDSTINSKGYSKLLRQKSKTKPKKSKIKWKEVGTELRTVPLIPRKLEFDLPETFSIPIFRRTGGNRVSGEIYSKEVILKPNYELGYIFGTFLGDGHAKLHKHNNSKSGSTSWSFGLNEMHIALKLKKCLKSIFDHSVKIKKDINKNIINVYFYHKPFSEFLHSFGKRSNKSLPENLFVNNKEYLEGLYRGLLDSDGCVDKKTGKEAFSNTSFKLIELFNVLCFIIKGHFPISYKRQKTAGNLVSCNKENLSDCWSSQTLINPKVRFTDKFYIGKFLSKTDLGLNVPVYDLQVDCDTHSFIVDNCIVHNSVCETKNTAGCTEKQFSAVFKFKELSREYGLPIISDGGIREPSNFTKAIGAGASSVMAGSIFARCPESAAKRIMVESEYKKEYFGMASRTAQERWRGGLKKGTCPEGKLVLLDEGEPVSELVERYWGALKSGITYAGAYDIKSFHEKAEFIRI